MKNLGKWMLGAAIVAGGLGLGAAKAQAAEFRVVIGGPRAYIPPSPGPGYAWVNGYNDGGYWTPGRWNFAGAGFRYDRDDYYRHADRDDSRRYDRDGDRGFNRDRDDHRDGDHFRR
jgi:hypothetical protein